MLCEKKMKTCNVVKDALVEYDNYKLLVHMT